MHTKPGLHTSATNEADILNMPHQPLYAGQKSPFKKQAKTKNPKDQQNTVTQEGLDIWSFDFQKYPSQVSHVF